MNIHSHIHSHSQHCTQCWWIFMCMWAKADVEVAWQSSEQSRYSQKCLRNFTGGNLHGHHTQRTHGAMKTSLLRQNDVTTSFWRNNDVIITPRVRWDGCMKCVDNVNTDSTSNGSWCMGIKGEMSGTVCVTFTWYMYIYELFIAFVCFVVCSLL